MSVQALGKFFDLPLKRWFAEEVPLPENTCPTIDCKAKPLQDILSEAIMFTYNVEEDDRRLRSSPDTFEKQRGDYPLRREFFNFEITLIHPHSDVQKILTGLGFKVVIK
jgi:erythronate-4-phosphate dehydrogenase